MTSQCKRSANRANAQASTGPKTKGGKARSARNAFRHGLSLPVSSDPLLTREITNLAREIAGRNSSPRRIELAHAAAEAHIDLMRVRKARHIRLTTLFNDDSYIPRALLERAKDDVKTVCRWLKQYGPNAEAPPGIMDPSELKSPIGAEKWIAILSDHSAELRAF
jgi:hypothetical protein